MMQQCVMVCVTEQFRCDRLIRRGRALADQCDYALEVVSVLPPEGNPRQNAFTLEYLFQCARSARARMRVYYATDAVRIVSECARRRNARILLLGSPGEKSSGFAAALRSALPDTSIEELSPAEPKQSALMRRPIAASAE